MDQTEHLEHPHHGNRLEDRRLVTGAGCYTSDWKLDGQLHVHFLRSDRAHAEIVSLDAGAAREAPGVIAVLTGADAIAAGYKQFYQMMTAPGIGGKTIARPDRPVLAAGRVRHVGEPVAMVVAESAAAAQDACDLITIEYRDLPPVALVEDALKPGAPELHAEAPGNIANQYEAGDNAAVEAAFARAHHIARCRVETSRVAPNPMEPRGCTIRYDAASDGYELYVPVQGINMMRLQTSVLTGLPEDKLIIRSREVGGSFGQRSQSYPEYAAMMIAAKKLGRPIKWVSTRSEGFQADTHGRGMTCDGELALDKDGRFLAMRMSYTIDLGAYPAPSGAASHVRNPSVCLTGVYRIPALYGHFRLVLTNTTPVAAYRGAGRPDCAYSIERLVDQAAVDLGIEPSELRRRNFIAPDAFPYKTPTGSTYEKADFARLQARAMELSNYAGFPGRAAEAKRRGRIRGIGMSTVIENTGAGAFPKDQVMIEARPDGTFDAFTVTHSQGQSHETTFAMIVGDTLGVAPDQVRIRQCVNERPLVGNHTGGSRSTAGAGSIHKVAALRLVEMMKPLAAEALGVEPSQVEFGGGSFRAPVSGKSVGLVELAKRHAGKSPNPLVATGEGSVGSTFPNACHVAEVEIDPDTGVVDVVNYTAVDDCGTVINHPIVEGQVMGAVIQGAGQIFGEQVVYDRDTAQLLAGSFMDYPMPRAGFIRHMNLDECPVPSETNVLGAKGCGEAGCGGSLPALAIAVLNALRPLGVRHFEMPMTPNRVWAAIEAARTSR